MALRSVDRSLSVYVGNLSPDVPFEEVEEIIFELFVQAGPVNGIKVEPKDTKGLYHKGFAFVQFLHEESVPYASALINGVSLYGRKLRVAPANQSRDRPPQSLPSPSSAAHTHHSPSVHPFPGGGGGVLAGSPHWSGPAPTPPLQHRSNSVPGASPHPSLPLPSPPGGGGGEYLPLDGSPHPHPSPAPGNHRLHQHRAGARDYPQWVSDQTRTTLIDYHERYLQQPPLHHHHRGDSRDDSGGGGHPIASGSPYDLSPSSSQPYPDRSGREYGSRTRTSPASSNSRDYPAQTPPQQHSTPLYSREFPHPRRHSYDNYQHSSSNGGGDYRSRYC